jgi:hypothetical protein
LNPNPEVKEAAVKDPAGEVHRLELIYPMLPFDKTTQFGIYELTQKLDQTEKISSFAVNFPVESESVNNKQIPEAQKASATGTVAGGTGLQNWLLGLLLLVAAVEWVVYIRGY